MTTARLRNLPSTEARMYLCIAVSLGLMYLVVGIGLPLIGDRGRAAQAAFFGFSRIRPAGILFTAVAATALLRLSIPPALGPVARLASTRIRLELAAISALVFFILRTRFINPDGMTLAFKFMRDIPLDGAHVSHDEMWELYVHSRFWVLTHRLFGWSVEGSYQVLSCLAGGVFVFLLLTYCRLLFGQRAFVAFLLIVSAGYMQLFFGDVENYSLTAVWVMGYLLASHLFLAARVSVILPTILLAVSLTFHLLSGFLLPSLVYLWMTAWRRRCRGQVLMAGLAFCLTVALTLLFFDRHGLPISSFWDSYAFGEGGHFLLDLAKPSWAYYFAIANLAFLLVPAWVLGIPLLIHGRIPMDSLNTHLVIASGSMATFVLLWRAQLGVYMDWNLFAIAALPISILVWRNVLELEVFEQAPRPIAALGLLFFAHSYSWVIANHFL